MNRSPEERCPVLDHALQWRGVGGNVWQEVGYVVNESNELLDVVVVSGCSPIAYALELIGIGMDSSIVDYMAKAFKLLGVKVAFTPFQEQLTVLETLEYHF